MTSASEGETEWQGSVQARLAAELRRARELAGLSGRELARRIKLSQATVSRIESGGRLPSAPEVQAWGEALKVSPETQERLDSLMNAAFTEVHPYRTALQKRRSGHLQDDIHDQEALARRLQVFQSSLVPGLLQTAGYAQRVFQLFPLRYSDVDLAAAVASRLDRQLGLYDGEKRFTFLMTEGALRWRPGPVAMLLAQLARIDSVSTLDNVSIGVIPSDREAVTSIGHGFALFDENSDGEEAYVTVETVHADIRVSKPEDVDLYRRRWALLQQMAIVDDDARHFLSRLAQDIRSTTE